MGAFNRMLPVEPWNDASPKLKMPPSPATSQYPCTPPDGEFTMSNQVDFNPNCDWKVVPATSTEPDVPVMRTVCARRPPSAAVRATTLTACNVPTVGYALW